MAEQWGIVAEFANPARLVDAVHGVRDEGYTKIETWTPFPIHGMDEAMGLPLSRVPWIVLGGGITGFLTGVILQWWSGAIAYPIVIGGKPLFAWEFGVPVIFELSILFGSFGAVFGMFFLNGMPRLFHPLDRVRAFRKVTDDGFFLTIEADDPRFDAETIMALLEKLGGTSIEEVEA